MTLDDAIEVLGSAVSLSINPSAGDEALDAVKDALAYTIPIDEIVSNQQVRELAARRNGKPITRATLRAWRTDSGFPAPFKELPGGIELWDRRAVAAWLKDNR